MAHANSIRDTITRLNLAEFAPGKERGKLCAARPLPSANVPVSIATPRAITFLEPEFDVCIETHESGKEHFNILEAVCIADICHNG